ncbi:MAG TPA: hypothetical protein VI542_15960, partial [Candidatus Tectomicrobia bacterium]
MRATQARQPAQPAFYQHSLAHLVDELQQLDTLLQRHIATRRPRHLAAQGLAVSKGVYITHEEVDTLLAQEASDDAQPRALASEHPGTTIAAKIAASAQRGIFLSLPYIAQLFSLSPFEVQTVIVCLAPELRRKYDTLYAYLQDDVTRKRPSVDIILELLCASEAERWRARTAVFSDQAPLFRHGILHRVEDPGNPSGASGLAQFLQLDQRILHYLLENAALDGRLNDYATLLPPAATLEQVLVDPALKAGMANVCQRWFAQQPPGRQPCVLYFQGPHGVGKQDLAMGLCTQRGRPLLYVDMPLLLAREPDVTTALRLLCREGLLWGAAVYLNLGDFAIQEGGQAKIWMRTLARLVDEYGQLTFLAGECPWSLPGVFAQDIFSAVELGMPDVPLRQAAWERALQRFPSPHRQVWAQQLASQFRLTPGQIQAAAAWVAQRRAMT